MFTDNLFFMIQIGFLLGSIGLLFKISHLSQPKEARVRVRIDRER